MLIKEYAKYTVTYGYSLFSKSYGFREGQGSSKKVIKQQLWPEFGSNVLHVITHVAIHLGVSDLERY